MEEPGNASALIPVGGGLQFLREGMQEKKQIGQIEGGSNLDIPWLSIEYKKKMGGAMSTYGVQFV